MAARLEGATKIYGIPLLVSGSLYSLLTPQTQNYMRQVDNVSVHGSDDVLKLFTCDIDPSCLQLDKKQAPLSSFQQKIKRVRSKMQRDAFR